MKNIQLTGRLFYRYCLQRINTKCAYLSQSIGHRPRDTVQEPVAEPIPLLKIPAPDSCKVS